MKTIRSILVSIDERIDVLKLTQADVASRGGDVNPFIADIMQLHINDLDMIKTALLEHQPVEA